MNNIDAKTKIIAVIGNPIEHSKSPLIHNAGLKKIGLNYVYLAFKIENVSDAIKAMKTLGIIGYSVTIPHKIEVMEYIDEINVTAKKIGAVNTIVNKNGKLLGYNTDCDGAINSLKEKTTLNGKIIYVLGSGGAARAIIAGLEKEGAKTTIFARNIKKAIVLGKEFNAKVRVFEEIDRNYDILINATPIGMFPNINQSPLPKEMLVKGRIVFDIIYNPIETKLLKEAKERGCITIEGIEMFLAQAITQFKLFTGCDAPKNIMKKVLIDELIKERGNNT